MKRLTFLFLLIPLTLFVSRVQAQEDTAVFLNILPGDSWEALSWRFDLEKENLLNINGAINPYLNPTIGNAILIPASNTENTGTAVFLKGQNLISTAVTHNLPLFELARANQIANPYQPHFGTLFIPNNDQIPRILPHDFTKLELSHIPAVPGQGIGWRAITTSEDSVESWLNGRSITVVQNRPALLGITGTGAFFGDGEPLLEIRTNDGSLWSQPWRFQDSDLWIYQQLTLTGAAAEIDQEAIQQERERLFMLWEQVTPIPQWDAPFQTPINSFLAISSPFGARRSYNGGPYRTYHEGVDYSAYGGTAVIAPANGTVVVAEQLYVRGGAVIIDHGLTVYSGFYHLSQVGVSIGDQVQTGTVVGEVGTTGLSTGNHLHWDLLVDGIWIDAQAWQTRDMPSWLLAGWQADW